MKRENKNKLKPFLTEINNFITSGFYSNLTSEKIKIFKEVYKSETGSMIYDKLLSCNSCKLNLVRDIHKLINSKNESKSQKRGT